MSNVVSLDGGPAPEMQPNPELIEYLEDMLEMARGGEIIGVAALPLHWDRTASFSAGGVIGGYAQLGALAILQQHLVTLNAG